MSNIQTDDSGAPARPATPKVDGLKLSALQNWSSNVPTSRRKLSIFAAAVLLTVFGIGGTWAATAKLGGALVSTGRVFAEGSNRVVQHLEGGIIEEIAVREGQHVDAGQIIVRLDETSNRSQLDRILVEKAISTIELARWRAEQDEAAEGFTVDLQSLDPVADHPRVVDTLKNHLAEFRSSRKARGQQLLILDGKIANEKEDLIYLDDQIRAYDSQKDLLSKEEKSYAELLAKGLIRQSQVFAIQRQIAQIEAQRSNALSAIQKSNHNIQSFIDEKQGILSTHAELTSKKITETQQKLNESEDYINRLNDMLHRAKIVAPVDGIILTLPFKSIGAVIQPGDKVAEILPSAASLMMEARVASKDITKVNLGQIVEIVFPNDQINLIPPLKGEVTYISADAFILESTGASYYISHIELDAERNGREILPGNVAEVFFQTEAKTLFEYIADPITRFALKTYTE